MRNIVKLVIILGLALQSGGHPVEVEPGGWAWCDDSQETVTLETRTYGLGWPFIFLSVIESWGCEVPIRVYNVAPLGVSFTGGFWLVLLWLLDSFWPGGVHND